MSNSAPAAVSGPPPLPSPRRTRSQRLTVSSPRRGPHPQGSSGATICLPIRDRNAYIHDDKCCTCGPTVKCITARCKCRAAGRVCKSTCCSKKCENQSEDPPVPVVAAQEQPQVSQLSTDDDVVHDDNNAPAPVNETTQQSQSDSSGSTTQVEISDLHPTIQKLAAVSDGHTISSSDGKLETGGVADDAVWLQRWDDVTCRPVRLYTLPEGKIGERFLILLATLIESVPERTHNWNVVTTFINVVLQKDPLVEGAPGIRELINERLNAWDSQRFEMLVSECVRCQKSLLYTAREEHSIEQRYELIEMLVNNRLTGPAAKMLFETQESKVLRPTDIDAKSGLPVLEVLKTKHPELTIPDPEVLEDYGGPPPDLPIIQVTDKSIKTVAGMMKGSGGLNGVDGVTLSDWLCSRKAASKRLRDALVKFTNWSFNNYTPWASHRELVACRLVALDKEPGVRPIGIGDIFRRFIAKVLLLHTGTEAMEACGADQLASGIPAGVEAGITYMRTKWEDFADDDDFGCMQFDAENGFCMMNRLHLLWTIRHRWCSAYHFSHNCYQNATTLRILPFETGQDVVDLLSRNGVIQGCPFAMIAYGIGTLPMLDELNKYLAQVEEDDDGDPSSKGKVMFADDLTVCGSMKVLEGAAEVVNNYGAPRGYFNNDEKTEVLVRANNHSLPKAEAILGSRFKIVTSARHLGGYLCSNPDDMEQHIGELTEQWERELEILSAFALHHPQAGHTIMQKVLQAKWTHTLRSNPGAGPLFEQLSFDVKNKYLPALFGDFIDDPQVRDDRFNQATLPYKYGGLSIMDPVREADRCHSESLQLTDYLVKAMKNETAFDVGQCLSLAKATRISCRDSRRSMHQDRHAQLLSVATPAQQRVLQRATCNSNHRSVQPSTKWGTVIPRVAFRDQLNIDFGRVPIDLMRTCDGCGKEFTVSHALTCPLGGMAIGRHDELRDELGILCQQALTQTAVRVEPMIHPIQAEVTASVEDDDNSNAAIQEHNNHNPVPIALTTVRENQRRGDLDVRSLNENGVSTIIDITVVDTDSPSYIHLPPMEVLKKKAIEKRQKHEEACKQNNKIFIPFVMSVDGCFDEEAKGLMRNLARRLSEKWEAPFSVVANYIYSRMSVALVRANNRCLRGSRIKANFASKPFVIPRVEDDAALRAYRMLF